MQCLKLKVNLSDLSDYIYVYICVCTYACVCVCVHTHAHTHTRLLLTGKWNDGISFQINYEVIISARLDIDRLGQDRR